MRSPAAAPPKAPISAMRPSRTPMSRTPIAVLVDHGPVDEDAIETRRHGGILSCVSAKAAYLTVSVLASATGGDSMHKKAAMLEDRGVVSRERRGCDRLSAGPADQRRRAARARRGALRGAALAAGQDPVRHDRRARARGDGAVLSARLRGARRRPISPSGSASISCAPRSRSPTRAPIVPSSPSGATSPSTLADGSSTPTRAIRASAGARSCRARSPPRSGPSTSTNTRACASRVGAPKGGVDFAYGGRLSARRQFRSSPSASISTRAAMSARRSSRA